MSYSVYINSIDAHGQCGDGDVFQGDDLSLAEAVSAVTRALSEMTKPDEDCGDAALDLTITRRF